MNNKLLLSEKLIRGCHDNLSPVFCEFKMLSPNIIPTKIQITLTTLRDYYVHQVRNGNS